MTEEKAQLEALLRERQRQRLWTAAILTAFVALITISVLGACSIGSPAIVEVYTQGETGKFKTLEILNKEGNVVLRADADDQGAGRVTFFDAEQTPVRVLPES